MCAPGPPDASFGITRSSARSPASAPLLQDPDAIRKMAPISRDDLKPIPPTVLELIIVVAEKRSPLIEVQGARRAFYGTANQPGLHRKRRACHCCSRGRARPPSIPTRLPICICRRIPQGIGPQRGDRKHGFRALRKPAAGFWPIPDSRSHFLIFLPRLCPHNAARSVPEGMCGGRSMPAMAGIIGAS